MRPYLFDDVPQLISSRLVGEEVWRERILGANRFTYSIGADAPIIDGACRPIEVGTRFPEMLVQENQRLLFEIDASPDPQLLHLPGRRGADAVKLPDRQRLYKGWAHIRGDDEEPVRFVVVGGKLREELVV